MKNVNDFAILHVATALTWRGGEQQVAYLVDELNKKNIRQYVLCSYGSAMEDYCKKNSIPFFTSNKRSAFDLSYALRIKKLCRNNNINIVHVHDSHAHTFAIYAALFGNKTRIIVSRRVDFEIGNGIFSKFKYNHKLIAKVICVSEKIKQVVSEAIDDKTKLVTIYSGIDLARFADKKNKGILHKEFKLPHDTKIIGNVSALAPHKDFGTFIETVKILKHKLSNTVFFIIGEGSEREKIEKLIISENLEKEIYITGFRNDIADILPEFDLFLMTSETEGLGTTLLDAFACGVAVVATKAGGIPELVIHEETGLLAEVGDAAALADGVERLIKDERLRTQLVTGAKKHLADFTKETTALKTLNEYLAVVGSDL